MTTNWLSALRTYLAATASLDLLWETAHLPLYTLWRSGSFGDKAFAVFHCTLGDVLIASAALTAALVAAGERAWPDKRFVPVALLTLAIGLGYTVYSEYRNVEVLRSWGYTDWMPRLPPFGTGLTPVLQWTVVPSLALALVWQRRGRV